ALVESCPDAVAMADLRGRVTFASQKAAEQHGFLHPEELLDKTAAELVVEADRDRFRANTLRLIEEGLRRDDEYRGLRQDGTTFDAEVTAAVIQDATGRPESLMAVYRDVSQRKRAEAQLRQSHEELQAICDGMVDGLLVADVDTRQFVQTNPVMCQMLGYSQEELLRLAVPDLHPPEDLPRLQAAFQAAAEGGLSAVRECRLVRKDRRIVYADINATAVVRGPRRYLVGFFHDVTERWRADEELKWSVRNQTALSSLLRGTLEAITLTKQLERALHVLLSIPWLALEPKGAIFTVDESTNTLVMRCQQGLSQEVVTNCSQLPVGTCLCGQAAASREIVFADKIDERHELHDPGMAPHGHYCVPILSGDRVLGVLNLYLREGHQANPNERIFLSTVADVLAELLVRHQAEASLREQEAELLGAKRIQQRLLPRSDPNLPGFDIAGASYPARLAGGDLFDFLAFPDGSLAIIIGDVCGHGMRSALVMAQTHAYLHAMGEAQSDLGAILTAANAILAGHLDEAMFVTLFCAKLEPRDRTLHYFSAGHPAVCVLDASGAVTRRLDSTAMPLGVEPHTVFAASGPIVLEPGDIALLLTDGILEAQARGGLVFGVERALDIVRVNRDKSAREIVESLCTAAREFSQPVEPEDDITAVVVKVGSPSG
nr:SpoIIE family protein phosphatase [Pirellulaceae bacterium]